MKPDTSTTALETAPGRRRLAGSNEQRGSRTGMSVAGALLFGGVFVAAGVAIILVGLRVIPVDPGSVHAPYWVIVVAGASFAGGGLAVWGMASTQARAERYGRLAARRFGDSSAMSDYAWNPRGYSPPRWRRAVRSLVVAGFMTLFLSMFNWWAWGAGAAWPVKVIVVVFDLILVLVWWKVVLGLGRAIKFGNSRLLFDGFPCRLAEPIRVRWMPPSGITGADRGSFTLRCVEEYYEERGSGNDRSRWLVHDELCAETQSFDVRQEFVPGRAVDLRFEAPTGARPTRLSADRPVFWQLEVKLARAGFDFEEQYLVPVYER